MKRIALILLTCSLLSCVEEEELSTLNGIWTISWHVDNEEISGELHFIDDQQAKMHINGQPGSLLIQERAGVDLLWAMDNHHLILTRQDNHIDLKYRILKIRASNIKLLYADDMSVNLTRK